jgi:hypothetical protein
MVLSDACAREAISIALWRLRCMITVANAKHRHRLYNLSENSVRSRVELLVNSAGYDDARCAVPGLNPEERQPRGLGIKIWGYLLVKSTAFSRGSRKFDHDSCRTHMSVIWLRIARINLVDENAGEHTPEELDRRLWLLGLLRLPHPEDTLVESRVRE